MTRVVMLGLLILLAQSMYGRPGTVSPAPGGGRMDRHIDAHIEPSQGTPAPRATERSDRDSAPPQPAVGTGVGPAWPPVVQPHRDSLGRDRRY